MEVYSLAPAGFDIERNSSYPLFPLGPVLRFDCRGVLNSDAKLLPFPETGKNTHGKQEKKSVPCHKKERNAGKWFRFVNSYT